MIADQNRLIAAQSDKINELKREIETLREDKYRESEKHREELARLREELTEIKRELETKANIQPRNTKGQYTKSADR